MKKVLVIGDGCEDIFRYGTCDRMSPEAPVAVMKPTRTTGNGGMAINVYENLKALGIETDIITNDIRPVKTRYVDEISNQMLLRVDENDEIERINLNVLHNLDFSQYNIVVISDYNKGFLVEFDIQYIVDHHSLIFMDTKKRIGDWAKGIDFIKINQKEYLENYQWFLKYNDTTLIMTSGKDGAILNRGEMFPINKNHEVRDLSGAGDTFLAALVADYVKNNDIRKAIRFANQCAAWVVSQKGVAVINPKKI